MRDGRTFARVRGERRCGYKMVMVVLAMQQVETAVLSAAEQRDVLHRAAVVRDNLIERTPNTGLPRDREQLPPAVELVAAHDAFCALHARPTDTPPHTQWPSPYGPVYPSPHRFLTAPNSTLVTTNDWYASSRKHGLSPRVARRLLSPGAHVGLPYSCSARDGSLQPQP